ncbi:hypothetical protein [Arcobacter caeni]|uniref:Uncharacterized protein n=1 Tax=Arcobacter caeni TaxID=1912877 RepID=A0A363CYF2_9BACT|nr:hypothetical protein [Arcobacter caeni]PUE63837.1 hypothetical protein B0174_09105 [Arcobacter caeni]
MKLEYAGLKPVINEHGISFKDGKEDKFIYLPFAVDILNAIDHTYEQKKKYSHQLNTTALSPNEILDVLLKFHPDLETVMNKEIESYTKHLDSEEEAVNNKTILSQIEKDTFIANLKLMRKYKTQRAKNKIFYFHCIETIVEVILKYKIKELDTPFNERFWHIFQTIEGNLSTHKIASDLKMTEENDVLKAMLQINIF